MADTSKHSHVRSATTCDHRPRGLLGEEFEASINQPRRDSGIVKVNVEPTPTRLSTPIVPP